MYIYIIFIIIYYSCFLFYCLLIVFAQFPSKGPAISFSEAQYIMARQIFHNFKSVFCVASVSQYLWSARKCYSHLICRSEEISSQGISSLSAKRRGADCVQVFQCHVVSCRCRCRCRCRGRVVIPPFSSSKGSGIWFGGLQEVPEAKFRSGSLQKPPGSYIRHQKSSFLKNFKSPKSQKSKIFKIGPRINNSARNLFRMIPHASITHFQQFSAKFCARIRQNSPTIHEDPFISMPWWVGYGIE